MTDHKNLEMLCGFCKVENVILEWKENIKVYRGMCPNEACEIWTVIKEAKP